MTWLLSVCLWVEFFLCIWSFSRMICHYNFSNDVIFVISSISKISKDVNRTGFTVFTWQLISKLLTVQRLSTDLLDSWVCSFIKRHNIVMRPLTHFKVKFKILKTTINWSWWFQMSRIPGYEQRLKAMLFDYFRWVESQDMSRGWELCCLIISDDPNPRIWAEAESHVVWLFQMSRIPEVERYAVFNWSWWFQMSRIRGYEQRLRAMLFDDFRWAESQDTSRGWKLCCLIISDEPNPRIRAEAESHAVWLFQMSRIQGYEQRLKTMLFDYFRWVESQDTSRGWKPCCVIISDESNPRIRAEAESYAVWLFQISRIPGYEQRLRALLFDYFRWAESKDTSRGWKLCCLIFQMSRIPGYEQRLKAMLFKANFNEKVHEMKEVIVA